MSGTKTGTVQWIDHYVTTSVDVPRFAAFHEKVLGAVTLPDPSGRLPGVFQKIASIRHGGFEAMEPLPPAKAAGKGMPRYGYYVYAADIDAHRRRLEAAGAEHSEPIRTSAFGDDGTAVYWRDPDGNQFEFWAPDVLPDGAMNDCGPDRVGRISHGTFESRDLDRTAAFFQRFCELEPIRNADIAGDVLALRLAAGGRLVFQRVSELGGRTTGMGLRDAHTALLVHTDNYLPNYRRLWAAVPEWDWDPAVGTRAEGAELLPARTVMHPSPPGRKFHAISRRGDDFLDWDTNMFHFYGGTPKGGTFTSYETHSVDYYIPEMERSISAAAAS